MWCLKTLLILSVVLILFAQDEPKEIVLGGVFEELNESSIYNADKIFKSAVELANKNLEYYGLRYRALTEEKGPMFSGAYKARLKTCSLVGQEALVIFGPEEMEEIDIVQSICDYKDIAHVITKWVHGPKYRSTINFYPHSSYLTQAYFNVIKLWDWKSFTLFYEDNESILRVGDLINIAKNDGIIVAVKQLSEDEDDVFRTTLKQAVQSGETNYVIDCNINILEEVLRQAQQVGLMTSHYNYFITNLDLQIIDLEPFQYSGANITGLRILDPDNDAARDLIRYIDSPVDLRRMSTQTALLIDAVLILTKVISTKLFYEGMEIASGGCDSLKSSRHGFTLANHVKTSKEIGLTGLIEFDGNGFRSNFDLDIVALEEEGIVKIGTWNLTKGPVMLPNGNNDIDPESMSLRNMSFIVITCLTDPFCMLKETSDRLYGNDRFEGFGIDLIHELSVMEGFNYTFIIREDKANGEKNQNTGIWSGMIGDVMQNVADLAITDLTITAEREEAVDFTSPFMNLGISILAKKPGNAPPGFFSFADPFAFDTWVMMALSYAGVSLSFFIMGRLCQDEWTNPYPCIEEPEFLINQFSLSNSFWFAVGSLMQQGTEIAPIAVSTRMVSGMWWFFVLIMVSSYTANLAAFLATENPITFFTDVNSLVENYETHNIKMGAKAKGATLSFFKKSDKPIYQKIAKYMETHKMPGDNKEGVKKAIEENYAFFMESSSIEYETQRHCELQMYGKLLDDKGYGIAMRKNSTYRKKLSTAILKLQSSGELDKLKRKWWEEKRGGGQCSAEEEENTPPLGLQNVQGVFYVTIGGTVCAVFLVIIEMIISTYKISRKVKISFKEAFKIEWSAFLDFNSNVKPTVKSESKHASKESSRDKDNGKTNNNMNSSPAPYGFVPTVIKEPLEE